MPIPKMESWKFTNRMGKSSKLTGKGVRKKLVHHSTSSIDFGSFGGDFTRSWLSLPLSHSTKVKGGGKKNTLGACSCQQMSSTIPRFSVSPSILTSAHHLRLQWSHHMAFRPWSLGMLICLVTSIYLLISFGHHGEKALKLQAFGSRREKDAIAILRQQ